MPSAENVDIFADPGLPSRLVERLIADTDGDGRYSFTHNRTRIPLRDDGTLDLPSVIRWSRDHESDLTVVVTEIPRRAAHRPKMAALHFAEGLVVISLPALGWFGLRRSLRVAVLESLEALSRYAATGDLDWSGVDFGVVHRQDSDTGPSCYVASPWWRPGRQRLVLGMVRTNEPLSTAPRLSGALAAASATGAFGIFYSSIWSMAEALPSWRLALVTVMSILVMVAWLLFGNGLWERQERLGSLAEAAMYNASTVVTLVLTVSLFYAALFLGILVSAAVVIDAGFMAETIKKSATAWNYVDIAWLSASMGTVAGALGSNFDSETDLRNLTHGRRQAMRYWEKEEAKEQART